MLFGGFANDSAVVQDLNLGQQGVLIIIKIKLIFLTPFCTKRGLIENIDEKLKDKESTFLYLHKLEKQCTDQLWLHLTDMVLGQNICNKILNTKQDRRQLIS